MPQWPSAASKQLKRWCWVCTSVWKTVNRCICPNINIIYITPKESLWSFSIIRIYALITHQSMVRSLSKSVTDKHNLTKPTSHTDFTCRYWTRWVMSHSPGWKSKWATHWTFFIRHELQQKSVVLYVTRVMMRRNLRPYWWTESICQYFPILIG